MLRDSRSMTAGELREAIEGVPDDVEVRVSDSIANNELLPIFRIRSARVVKSAQDATVEILRPSQDVAGKSCVIVCLTP